MYSDTCALLIECVNLHGEIEILIQKENLYITLDVFMDSYFMYSDTCAFL